MIEILKMSCQDDMDCVDDNGSNPYLERRDVGVESHPPASPMSKEEQTEQIKHLFMKYTAEGIAPNQAAAKAINEIASKAKSDKEQENLLPGTLKGQIMNSVAESHTVTPHLTPIRDVLHTAKKYVENVQKKPYSPKFRSFKVSNRIFDNITLAEGGLEYIVKCLGFRTYITSSDYMASIPLGVDTDALKERIEQLLNSL